MRPCGRNRGGGKLVNKEGQGGSARLGATPRGHTQRPGVNKNQRSIAYPRLPPASRVVMIVERK